MTDKANISVQPRPAETDDTKVSKAQQDRLAEFRLTHRVPAGYSYNVRDGLHKTPKKDR